MSDINIDPVGGSGIPTVPVIYKTSTTSTSITLNFECNGATGYFYSINKGISYTKATETASPITISSLTANTLYTIQLIGNNTVGNSSVSIPFSTYLGGSTLAKYVAGGTFSAKSVGKFSVSGTNWYNSVIPVLNVTNIYHNSSVWVAGGTSDANTNSIATSSDGINWTPSSNAKSIITNIYGVYFANGKWVAVGSGGNSIASSTDGITWAGLSTTLLNANGRTIINRNGFWMAGGTNGTIATSPNATTWTAVSSFPINQSVNSFDWDGNVIVAVGSGTDTQIVYSVTGNLNASSYVWQTAYVGPNVATSANTNSSSLTSVFWANGKFIATGYSTTGTAQLYTSTNGRTWSIISLSADVTPYLSSVNYYDGIQQWVIAGNASAISPSAVCVSLDGTTWTNATNVNSTLAYGDAINAIAPYNYIRQIGFTATTSASMWYSYNGLNWFNRTVSGLPATAQPVKTIVNNESVWLAGLTNSGTSSTIYYSTNGLAWTAATGTITGGSISSIVYDGNSTFVAFSSAVNGIVYSTNNGSSWTTLNTAPLNVKLTALSYSAGKWIAGSGTTILTATTPTAVANWTSTALSASMPGTTNIVDIAYSGTGWAILCDSTQKLLYYSTNLTGTPTVIAANSIVGTTKTITKANTWGTSVGIGSLIYAGGKFVGCGNGSQSGNSFVLTSVNGRDWSFANVYSTALSSVHNSIAYNDYGYTISTNTNALSANSKFYPLFISPDGTKWTYNSSFYTTATSIVYETASRYVKPGNAPTITNMAVADIGAGYSTFTISFTESASNGYPASYQYSVDNTNNFTVIPGGNPFTLTLSTGIHTVYLRAFGDGWTSSSVSATNSFITGTTPNIQSAVVGPNKLTVTLNPSTGGYPSPTNYIIAYDAGFINVGANVSSVPTNLVLTNLPNQSYSIYAKAISGSYWTSGTDSSAIPYWVGNVVPVVNLTSIPEITPSNNGAPNGKIVVAPFIYSVSGIPNGYPTAYKYYYTISGDIHDGSVAYYMGTIFDADGFQIDIPNAKPTNYTFTVIAENLAGNVVSNRTGPIIPHIIPAMKQMTLSIASGDLNQAVVYFSDFGNLIVGYDTVEDLSNSGLYYPITNISYTLSVQYLNFYGFKQYPIYPPSPYTLELFDASFNVGLNVYSKNPITNQNAWSKNYYFGSYRVNSRGNASITAYPVLEQPGNVRVQYTEYFTHFGSPSPTTYYYSLNGDNYVELSPTSVINGNLIISGVPSQQCNIVSYTKSVGKLQDGITVGTIWTSEVSAPATVTPYYAGSEISNISTVSTYESIIVNFTPSVGGNPVANMYYCALDNSGSGNFIYTNTTTPIVISNLKISGTRNIFIKYVGFDETNVAWTSNVYSTTGRPHITGSTPDIQTIVVDYNSLIINVAESTGGYPEPTYLVAFDPDFTTIVGSSSTNSIHIYGLTTGETYNVYVKAIGQSYWTSNISGPVTSGVIQSVVIGTIPTFAEVTPGLNSLNITLNASINGDPYPTNYLIAFDPNFNDVRANIPYPDTSATLSGLENREYTIYSKAISGQYWSTSYSSTTATPYYKPSDPVITNTIGLDKAVEVHFTEPADGNPASKYYCAIDSSASEYFIYSNMHSPIIIGPLPDSAVGKSHKIFLKSIGIVNGSVIWTSNIVEGTGQPYGTGHPPVLSATSNVGSIDFFIGPSTGGYPDPDMYYYTVSGGTHSSDQLISISPANIANPIHITANTVELYTFTVFAHNDAGNTTVSTITKIPYIQSTQQPVIRNIELGANRYTISFDGLINDDSYYPTTILYRVRATSKNNNTITYSNTGYSSPITINGITTISEYTIYVSAEAYDGSTYAWEKTQYQTANALAPYYVGQAPTITNVAPGMYSLTTTFAPSNSGNPLATSYEYSYDNGNTYSQITTGNTFTVSGLSKTPYRMYVREYNPLWEAYTPAGIATTATIPYYESEPPTITSIGSASRTLIVNFTPVTGGNPITSHYVCAIDSPTDFIYSNVGSPIIINHLTTPTHTVYLKSAGNLEGTSTTIWTSNIVSATGNAYIPYDPPIIQEVNAEINNAYKPVLTVKLIPSTNGYPAEHVYSYSVNGESFIQLTDADFTKDPIYWSFTISNLNDVRYYNSNIAVKITNQGGDSGNAYATGYPYLVGNPPVISEIRSDTNSVLVYFIDGLYSRPSPVSYFYTLTGGTPTITAPNISSPIRIAGLNNATYSNIAISAVNMVGTTQPSNYLLGIPNLTGNAPVITGISGEDHRLRVFFSGPTNAYPVPTTYYYSANGGDFVLADQSSSPIVITGLDYAVEYEVRLFGQNIAGNTDISDPSSGIPWIIGSSPTIGIVSPRLESLIIQFTDGTGGNPPPSAYYYSVDSNPYTLAQNVVDRTFTIPNLKINKTYTINLIAHNSLGNTLPSLPVDGRPWIIGSPPTISNIAIGNNQLTVSFTDALDGNPPTTKYYYSLNDGTGYKPVDTVINSQFIIPNLAVRNYSVTMIAENDGGNTLPSNVESATPYGIGLAPNITAISSELNQIIVYFTDDFAGNPPPFKYHYLLDNDTTTRYEAQIINTIPRSFIVPANENKTYLVSVSAQNTAGNTQPSTQIPGRPYIKNSPPTIRVESAPSQLIVYITPSTDGYPTTATSYYISDNSGISYNEYSITQSSAYPFTYSTSDARTIYVKVHNNEVGNTEPAISAPIRPYIVGSPPVITDISAVINGLAVNCTLPEGGYPNPDHYVYYVDGTEYTTANNSLPILIPNLNLAKNYTIKLKAVNSAGTTELSDPLDGMPFVVWGKPVISVNGVTNSSYSLRITINPLLSPVGNPDPDYYYYSLNGAPYQTATPEGNGFQFTLHPLINSAPYTVNVITHNFAGNSVVSNDASGKVFMIGNPPIVESVTSIFQGIDVSFSLSEGGYPAPILYYYSLDDGYSYRPIDDITSPITIGNLTVPNEIYQVRLIATNDAGNTQPSNSKEGRPSLIGTAPTIDRIENGPAKLTVHLIPGNGEYPATTTYYYSLETDDTVVPTTFYDSQQTGNTVVINVPNYTTPTLYYVTLMAHNDVGNTAISNAVSGYPWIVGTTPTILNIKSGYHSLIVNFAESTNGYPTPPTYYYSLDGATGDFKRANETQSPIIIPNLSTLTEYSVAIKAQYYEGEGGNTGISNTLNATPGIIGSAPNIRSTQAGFHSITVNFDESSGGYPKPPTYYYSLNGTAGEFKSSEKTSSPITIDNLSTLTEYTIAIKAYYTDVGNTEPSNTYPAKPGIIGTIPIISLVDSSFQSLVVYFDKSTGGYPEPIYHYSLTGANDTFKPAGSIIDSSFIIPDLTTATQYTVVLKAEYPNVGNTETSGPVQATPFIIGGEPTITSVDSSLNKLIVQFTQTVKGYPDPPYYYYSVAGNTGNFANSQVTSSPIEIPLYTVGTYNIALKAYNTVGYSNISNTVPGNPYIIGSAPFIQSVTGASGEITIAFTTPNDWYPTPSYKYSLDSGSTYSPLSYSESPIVVSGFTVPTNCNVKIKAINTAGNLESNQVTGQPLIIGSPPSISAITSKYESLEVSFSPSERGYPDTPVYYYSIAGTSGNFLPANVVSSSPPLIVIDNLKTTEERSVVLFAKYDAGNTGPSNVKTATPLILGSVPEITTVESIYQGLKVIFTKSTGGYPEPPTYHYSLTGENGIFKPVSSSSIIDSSFVIPNLTTATQYTIVLKAEYSNIGNTNVSNMVSAMPLIIGSEPTITAVDSSLNKLIVRFTPGTIPGNPVPPYYYYSVSGETGPFANSQVTSSPIEIPLYILGTYNIVLKAYNTVGYSNVSNMVPGMPYTIGSAPNIQSVVTGYHRLTVNFEPSIGGNPPPNKYYYSLNGINGPFKDSGVLVSPIIIDDLSALVQYSVVLKAGSDVGNTEVSNQINGTPGIVGSPPVILNANSRYESLEVSFTPSKDGYPDTPIYYYSIAGESGPFLLANVISLSPPLISVGNLKTADNYSVVLRAKYEFGNTEISNSKQGMPWIIGSAPTIGTVESRYESLLVNFTDGTGGNPLPDKYYYSLNGEPYVEAIEKSSPITINNLTSASTYKIQIISHNSAGNTQPSNEGQGIPLVLGTPPTLLDASSIENGLVIRFTESGGYPLPTYWYSTDGGNNYVTSGLKTSPITILGLNANTTIYLLAVSSAGNLSATNTISGRPYTTGPAPTITSVSSALNSLVVKYTISPDTNPTPSKMQYLIEGYTNFVDVSNTGEIAVSGLTQNRTYNVDIRAVNSIGATGNARISGAPYLTGTVAIDVSSIYNGFDISFTVQGANPTPTAYYYTLNATSPNASYYPGDVTSTNPPKITITGLTVANSYNVALVAHNLVGNTPPSNVVVNIKPYVIGSVPHIGNIVGDINSLVVYFDESTGGYPTPTYYYSVSGNVFSQENVPAVLNNTTPQSFTIPVLIWKGKYSVSMKAVSIAGNTAVSNTEYGQPITGYTIKIGNVRSLIEGIEINLNTSWDGEVNKPEVTYRYSLSGLFGQYEPANQTVSPIIVGNLTTVATYQVAVEALVKTITGNLITIKSNVAEGRPYIFQSAPYIDKTTSVYGGVDVSFNKSTGGYPDTTLSYYYSLDGGVNYEDSGKTESPIRVPINVKGTYNIMLKSRSAIGFSPVSNSVIGIPYVVAKAPNILRINVDYYTASVQFGPALDGYPEIVSYQYSVDDGSSVNLSTMMIELNELLSGQAYKVKIWGVDMNGVFSKEATVTINTKSLAKFYRDTMNPFYDRNRPIYVGDRPKYVDLPSSLNDTTETQVEREIRTLEHSEKK